MINALTLFPNCCRWLSNRNSSKQLLFSKARNIETIPSPVTKLLSMFKTFSVLLIWSKLERRIWILALETNESNSFFSFFTKKVLLHKPRKWNICTSSRTIIIFCIWFRYFKKRTNGYFILFVGERYVLTEHLKLVQNNSIFYLKSTAAVKSCSRNIENNFKECLFTIWHTLLGWMEIQSCFWWDQRLISFKTCQWKVIGNLKTYFGNKKWSQAPTSYRKQHNELNRRPSDLSVTCGRRATSKCSKSIWNLLTRYESFFLHVCELSTMCVFIHTNAEHPFFGSVCKSFVTLGLPGSG